MLCATISVDLLASYNVMEDSAAKVKHRSLEPSFSGIEALPTPLCAAFQKETEKR